MNAQIKNLLLVFVLLGFCGCLCGASRTELSDSTRREEAPSSPALFLRGDANADGTVDMSDALSILSCQFAGTNCTSCTDAADVNDDNTIDLSDALSGLNFLFRGSDSPPQPFPACGIDLTPSDLGCFAYPVCATPIKLVREENRAPGRGGQLLNNVWKDLPPSLFGARDIVYRENQPDYDRDLFLIAPSGFKKKAVGVEGKRPAWQPGGDQIAFEAGLDIYVVNEDGSGLKNLTGDGDAHWDFTPAWSPDGKKIVFQRDNDLHVLTPGSLRMPTSIVRITTASDIDSRDYEPAWSPDGSRIAFVRSHNQSGSFDIYLVDPDGSNLAQVTSTPHQDRDPSWHPDGNMLVFSRRQHGDHNNNDLKLLLFAGAFQFTMPLTSDPELQDLRPSFSPDGDTIVFMRRSVEDIHLRNIFTIKINGGGLLQLTHHSVDEKRSAMDPHWRW